MVVIAVRKDSVRLALEVFELVVSEQPEEGHEPEQTQANRHRDEEGEDVHGRRPSRSALRQTTSELADMVIAANSGVTRPAKAIGTVTKL